MMFLLIYWPATKPLLVIDTSNDDKIFDYDDSDNRPVDDK